MQLCTFNNVNVSKYASKRMIRKKKLNQEKVKEIEQKVDRHIMVNSYTTLYNDL